MEHRQIKFLKAKARCDLNGRWTPFVLNTLSLICIALMLRLLVTSISGGKGIISIIAYYTAITAVAIFTALLKTGYYNIFLTTDRILDEFEFHRQFNEDTGNDYNPGMGQPVERPAGIFSVFRIKPDRFILYYFFFACAGILLVLPLRAIPSLHLKVIYLIIVGIVFYYFALCFSLTGFLLLDDHDLGTIDAMAASYKMMQGNKLRRFLIDLSFIGWILLGLLSAGIGLLWIIPYISDTHVRFYMELISR